jgi:hypothetical protein
MSNSQHYKIITGKDLIFGKNGSMKLHSQKMSFASSIYTVPIILSKLDKGQWVKIGEIDLKYKQNEIQSFGEIQNFQFRVIDVSIADNGKMIIEIEMKELNNNNELKCVVCPLSATIGYFDGKKLHHFCSEKCLKGKKRKLEIVEEEIPTKKLKFDVNEIKKIDILMIGLDHNEKELMVKVNLKDCLHGFSNEFNTIEINNKKRKPFLIFWEQLTKENQVESINLSNIDGRGTESWFLPKENDIIGAFTFMQQSFEALRYQVNYDSNGIPDNAKNEEIQKNIIGNINESMDDLIKKYGSLSPIALIQAWAFAYEFLRDLLMNNNINNTSFLELFIPDRELINEFIKELRELWISCIESNRDYLESYITGIIAESFNNMIIDKSDINGLFINLYEQKFPKDNNELFTKESHITLLKLIYQNKLNFIRNAQTIKILIRKYWLKITSLVKTKNVTYPLNLDLKITLNYSRNFNPIINQEFFLKLTDDLKSNISIDIPTLLYSGFMDNILENKKPKEDYIDLTVQVRDYIGAQTMIDICNYTNIKRCIFLQGSYHNVTLEEILVNDSSNEIRFNIQKYSVITHMGSINIVTSVYSDRDVIKRFKKYKKILYFYLILERIDEWLWLGETDTILKKRITLDNGKSLHKLQYYSKISEYLKLPHPTNTDYMPRKLEKDFKYYIGLIMASNQPKYIYKDNFQYFKKNENYLKKFPNAEIIRENGSLFKHNIHYMYQGTLTIKENDDFMEFIDFIKEASTQPHSIDIVKIE